MNKNFYVMFLDSETVKTVAETKTIALNNIFKSKSHEYEDYNDFFFDLNYVEWEENGLYYLQNLVTDTLESSKFPYLSKFLTFNPIAEPVEELVSEFETDYV